MCTSNIWWAGRLNDMQIKSMSMIIEIVTILLSIIVFISLSVAIDTCSNGDCKQWHCIFDIMALTIICVLYVGYMLFRYRVYKIKQKYGYDDIHDSDFKIENNVFDDEDDYFVEDETIDV